LKAVLKISADKFNSKPKIILKTT